MKIAIVIVLSVSVMVMAEPPRRLNSRQRNFGFFARQEETTPTPPADNGAPYPPSGWRPSGAEFRLPARQSDAPNDKYGPPPSYGPPPEEPTTVTPDETTEGTTLSPDAENLELKKGQTESVFKNTDRGLYYVYLPDGRLQRVVYMTSADLQNMDYTARVRYQNVDPVAAPIYSVTNNVPLERQRILQILP